MTPLLALLLSLSVEAPIAATVVAIDGRCRPIGAAAAAVVGTSLTHGLAWDAVFTATDHMDWIPAVLLVEAAVVLVEAVVYRAMTPLSIPRSLFVSLLANAGSTALGLGLWLAGVE